MALHKHTQLKMLNVQQRRVARQVKVVFCDSWRALKTSTASHTLPQLPQRILPLSQFVQLSDNKPTALRHPQFSNSTSALRLCIAEIGFHIAPGYMQRHQHSRHCGCHHHSLYPALSKTSRFRVSGPPSRFCVELFTIREAL